MFGPFANISPTPSLSGLSIFISTLSKGYPIEPGLCLFSASAVNTGDVSVSPYPCIELIPKLFNPIIVSLSNDAAPYSTILSFPPKLSIICLNTIFLISICIFSNAFDIFVIVFIIFVFPWSAIAFIIFLYIVSNTSGTATNIDTSYSFKFAWMYLSPSQNAIVAPL